MSQLRNIGEDEVIRRITAGLASPESVLCGPGDDCAVVDVGAADLQLLKTDAVVEGVHFLAEEEPERVGWKAIARVMSDFAAMGGWPQHFVVTIALSGGRDISWVEGLYTGLENCCCAHGGAIVGGETTSLPAAAPAMISVAGTGAVGRGKWISRSGAQPCDLICVTGLLGGSIAGKHLDFTPRLEEGKWLAETGMVSAMMDLSDGLAKDLPRLAALSGCGYRIDGDRLPLTPGCEVSAALGDGEDYELLVILRDESVLQDWPFDIPLTQVGTMEKQEVVSLPSGGGWEHFRG